MGTSKLLKIYALILIVCILIFALIIVISYILFPSLCIELFEKNSIISKSIDIFINLIYGIFGSALFAYFIGHSVYNAERKKNVILYARYLQDFGNTCLQVCSSGSYHLIEQSLYNQNSPDGDFLYFKTLSKNSEFDIYDALNEAKTLVFSIKEESLDIITNFENQSKLKDLKAKITDDILKEMVDTKKKSETTYKLDDWDLFEQIDEIDKKILSFQSSFTVNKNKLKENAESLIKVSQHIQKNAERVSSIHSASI